ncbi:MAG: amino acid ABC transporter ATP-binding protein [Proteobacteria bacterium]|nr:amino acid ABC transporter ATP-binding protein [Pseudomonadota bacterium]MBU1585428.1 amino acid ABC transporter ATP-binding protein [Pseudomonadota bacterium]MBU2454647.1 amino acid ABC transporter ATP-binding protein [Pseudomonadota bacterium]MBU2629230.1 amino acid ABC transporter ATP-binding protein [Pseudomonadota bacterium]
MVKITNIHKVYGKNLHVLRGIDLNVNKGETVVILGASGSGKSTLLRCINFLEEPTAGTVEVDNIVVTAGGTDKLRENRILDIRKRTGMCFQAFNLFPHMTALENIIEGPTTVLGQEKKHAVQYAKELLEWVGLTEKRDEYPSCLSGGQQQRVAIARSLAMKPTVMLFDEPTSALDPELVGEVVEVMERLAKEGMTIIAVTHELHFARDVADRVLIMDQGNWIEEGPPGKIFNNPEKERTRQFLAHIL